MRLRLPELLHECGLSAKEVVRRSNGRISERTIYRLTGAKGRVEYFSATVTGALCDALGVPPARLFEHPPLRPKRKRA